MKTGNRKWIQSIFYTLFAPMVLIIIWQLAGAFGLINTSIMPSPSKIFKKMIDLLANGKLVGNLVVSIGRVILGFLIGATAGIGLGVALGLFPKMFKILNSLIGILRPVPMIAWIPILILGLGIGEASKVTVIAIGTFWPVLLNTIHGIQTTNPQFLDVAIVLEKSRGEILRKIVIPSAIPSIITGLKIGSSTAWSCVVAAEMIAASKGVGFMIMYAREMSQPATIFVGVFVIGLIGLGIDKLFNLLSKRLLRWDYIGKKE